MRTKDFEVRVWDKRNKTMVYLNDFNMCDWSMASMHIYKEDDSTHPESDFGGYEIKSQVLNPPIMLFSGLRDSKKKKVFEGDVVKFEYQEEGYFDRIGYVYFDRGSFRIKEKHDDDLMLWFINYQCDVIGNIYQNPELLKTL